MYGLDIPQVPREGAHNFLMSFEAVSSQTAEMKGALVEPYLLSFSH